MGMDSLIVRTDAVLSDFARRDSPGCALAVVKDGNIIHKQGYGMASLEFDVPITPSTIFHVASVSKQFTAMAVALLVHEGKLSLEDDIRRHFPELHEFGEKITIRHLAHHISGIRDQWSLAMLASWRMDDVITMDDILELLTAQRELNFKPGAEYLYSNSGYTLMALIVERVSGKPFPDFCRERIFQPLGMRDTHFHLDHRQIVKNRAYSYEPDTLKGFRKSVLSYANVGATSLFTTVEDMALWDRNFYTATVGGSEVIDMMHTQGILNDGRQIKYAFGLEISRYRGLRTVGHSGGDVGYRSNILRFPDRRFSAIILSNLSTANPSMLSRKLADIWLEYEFPEKPVEPEPVAKVEPSKLQSLAGTYHNPTIHTTYRIAYKEGKLYAQLGRDIELQAVSQERLRAAPLGPDTVVEFKPSGTAGKNELHVLIPGEPPVIYQEMDPHEPTEEEKAEYAGTFHCPELDTNYYIITENGTLQLKTRKYGKVPLTPAFRNAFTLGTNDIQFERDQQGKIQGFRLSTGRVRRLRFRKAE